jgi:antitoxin ParD1/3/4
MSYALPPDVLQQIEARLAGGEYASADDVLRDALRALTEEAEDVAAVREALAEWRAGDPGVPLREAISQVRHG